MEVLDDKHNYSFVGRLKTDAKEGENKKDMVERLICFFSLTKEERLKAGIFVGNEGRNWMDNAALILPPPEYWE